MKTTADTTQSHDAVRGDRNRSVGQCRLHSVPRQHKALEAVAGDAEEEESSESELRAPESLASWRCYACNATNKVCIIFKYPGKLLIATDGCAEEWEATRRCLTAPISCPSCGV